MSTLDLIILGLLGLSILYSFVRGAVREIFSLLSLIVGYMVATRIYGYGAAYIEGTVSNPRLAGVISFVVVFLTISVLVAAAGRMLHVAAKKAHLSLANRTLGAAIGFLKGVVLVSILLLLIPVFSKQASQGQLLKDSAIAPFFDVATEALSSAFPTRKYGALDNRLTRELQAVRENRRPGLWEEISRRIQRWRASGPAKHVQTEEEERQIQKLLKP